MGKTLYRFAQDCSRTYGGNLNLMEIETLSHTDYNERLAYFQVRSGMESSRGASRQRRDVQRINGSRDRWKTVRSLPYS